MVPTRKVFTVATVLLPILPGTLPPGICFASEQERLNEFSANMSAQLPGLAYYNFGNTKPLPADNAYPWLNTLDMEWYQFVGVWQRPHPVTPSGNDRQLWVGTLAALITKDGGTAGAVTATSGPFWEEDTDQVDKVPIGAGTIAAVGVNAGPTNVTITNANLPFKRLTMFQRGLIGPGTGDLTASDSCAEGINVSQSEDYVIRPALNPTAEPDIGLTGSFGQVTPTAVTTTPPYRGIYFIKRTARIYMTVP